MRMLDGTGIVLQGDPGDENDHPSVSVHSMQQQQPRREDLVEYYARRAREAQAQSDARKGEVFDDDLDTWVEITIPPRPTVRNVLRECIEEALCGPMGRVAD